MQQFSMDVRCRLVLQLAHVAKHGSKIRTAVRIGCCMVIVMVIVNYSTLTGSPASAAVVVSSNQRSNGSVSYEVTFSRKKCFLNMASLQLQLNTFQNHSAREQHAFHNFSFNLAQLQQLLYTVPPQHKGLHCRARCVIRCDQLLCHQHADQQLMSCRLSCACRMFHM